MRPKTQNHGQVKVNGNVVTVLRRTNCAKVDAFSSQMKGVVDTDVDEYDGCGTQGDELDLRAARNGALWVLTFVSFKKFCGFQHTLLLITFHW